ncbi:Outer surface protein (plasmid) [Borrelia hermsii YBT]|uniref:Outer surface protein n=1 Tax=Borrelia hermsii YBT TaxID=1313295 RepID=W5T122_BORHE|nr:BBA14 family lipoprotein [Borrelia hermsii]AHH13239.1 Outer surface protein [Borrelia hermsii YBT]
MKKLVNLTFLTLIFSCTSIASLTEEPTFPKTQTLTELSTYEAQLSDYVMYLQVFLTRTKKKVNDTKYPKFTYFDTSALKSEQTIQDLMFNINIFKEYIKITKPIAEAVYKKYSKLQN